MVNDALAGHLLIWGDLGNARFSWVAKPGADVPALQARLERKLRSAVAVVGGEVEWSDDKLECELHASVIESEAQAAARRERERRERAEGYAAEPEREELASGIVRIKSPPGFRYELHGRAFTWGCRCRGCEVYGVFADTKRCPDCEGESCVAVEVQDV